ncbi:hypothetical protein, conserved [Leishmania lindenbergi]|uniref:C2H2-type domain-containing protein n=1 Tax=Leishmania lindenbergi TaxID=651832 RepID=A0AAW3AXS3_9TRYP
MHTAVLRQASTPSTCPPGTTDDGLGSSRVHNGGSSDRCASAPPRSGNSAGATPRPLSLPPSESPEVRFYDTFLLSSVDLHLILLEEAHYKHGVWLNVPPQLAPSIPDMGPPAVPEPLYPTTQQARLAAMATALAAAQAKGKCGPKASSRGTTDAELIREPTCLAYRPTHGPPPFSTTGTSSLWISEQRLGATGAASSPPAGDAVASAFASVASPTTASAVEGGVAEGATQTGVHTVAIRGPVDASLLYHCSECGRPFRRRQAAELHVQQRHEQHGSSAAVVEGPGPGEVLGYEERPLSVATTAATKTAAAACQQSILPRKCAEEASGEDAGGGHVTAGKGVADASGAGRLSGFGLSAAYCSPPRVELPGDALIDSLLEDVWDDVGLTRDDIDKPADLPTGRAGLQQHPKRAYSSCHGRFFIPSVLFVEGTADNRAELEAAAAARPVARATPEGAAPGIKRRPSSVSSVLSSSTIAARLLLAQQRNADGTLGAGGDGAAIGRGIGGGTLGAAPTAQELSIAELSRHYPNPFGDSPNATLMESEREPINPFIDLEGKAAAVDASQKASCDAVTQSGAAADSTADEAVLAPVTEEMEWLSRWAARPYACPLCQRRALPDVMRIMAPLLPSSLRADIDATTSGTLTAGAYGDDRGASWCPESGSKLATAAAAAAAAEGLTPGATAGASLSKPAGGAPPPGSLEDQPLVADVEAWSWYAERVPRFRLLDSLEGHLQSKHPGCCCGDDEAEAARDDGTGVDGYDTLSDADWRRLYHVARHQRLLARAELLAVQRAYRIMFPTQRITSAEALSSAKRNGIAFLNDIDGDAGKDGARNAAIPDEASDTGDASAGDSPASVSASDATAAEDTDVPQVHVRSAVNTVLIGTVRDVQEGFLGATRIMQYVLAVRDTTAESQGSMSADEMGSNVVANQEEDGGADVDEDLIVVRCVGDLVPVALLKQQVRLGSTMFVAGSLRMNRNVDTVSRRSHAYPYVKVVPPLGCVRVLGA